LYQGPALDGPPRSPIDSGFSPASCLKPGAKAHVLLGLHSARLRSCPDTNRDAGWWPRHHSNLSSTYAGSPSNLRLLGACPELHRRVGILLCIRVGLSSPALYQGRALDGPPRSPIELGFSPCCFCFTRYAKQKGNSSAEPTSPAFTGFSAI
jgi:hypothetical protein